MRAFLSAWSLRHGVGPAVACYGLLVLAQACTTVPTTLATATTIAPGTTALSLDPATFLGSVVCSGQAGAMQSYVATLTDVVQPCGDPSECAAGACAGGVCVQPSTCTRDKDCPPPAATGSCHAGVCLGAAGACAGDSECRGGACVHYCTNTLSRPQTACFEATDCACIPSAQCTCDATKDPPGCLGTCSDGVCSSRFALPSSPPTSCSQTVFFQYVTPGHQYVADVDGYEAPPEKLVPLCGSAPPGPAAGCQADQDCHQAYGCTGTCTVATYVDGDYTCLVNQCHADPACLAAHAYCQTGTVAEYLACVQPCGATDDCLTNVAVPKNCLVEDFQTQAPCGDAPVDTAPPSGGSGDVVLRGQIKACTCSYVATEGARQMFDRDQPQSAARVSPRWETPPASPCGAADLPAAQLYVDVPITSCAPLIDHGAATPQVTAIQVVPAAALGGSACALTGFDGGTIPVSGFNVVPAAATGLPAKTLATCDAQPDAGNPQDVAVYTDVVPSRTYAISLQAVGAGAQIVATSQCFATPVAGITVTAMCDPLIPVP